MGTERIGTRKQRLLRLQTRAGWPLEESNRSHLKNPGLQLYLSSGPIRRAPARVHTGQPLVPGVWFQYDIVVSGNHDEVTLTNTQSGASQITTIFDNPDAARGIAQLNGQPAGFVCIQSYSSSPLAFRDIWIK
jgi:hypothetical protein